MNYEEQREEVIAKYRSYFLSKVLEDLEMQAKLNQIWERLLHTGHVALECYCAPKPCHCDVIKEFLEGCVERSQEPKRVKVIVAGGREFKDAEMLKEVIDKYQAEKGNIEIVSGMAKGADKLGWWYAKHYGTGLAEFPADWNRLGRRAGYLRNEQMAKYADECIAFWDGESRGTMHMINIMEKMGKPVLVIKY
jgi:hypothetical protein